MKTESLFDSFWADYTRNTPSANEIQTLLEARGEKIKNDHIAIRTINDSRIDIHKLSVPFIKSGYRVKGDYLFKEKHLRAIHLEHQTDASAPKVFISELILQSFPHSVKELLTRCTDQIPLGLLHNDAVVYSGRTWGTISHRAYEMLREASEYAAWFYVYGFCANHFTVNVNNLKSIFSLEELNSFLKENGFRLNNSGGEIKGSKDQMLQQSSTLADFKKVEFIEGVYNIPSCYYEFAERFPDEKGKLFNGFIVNSANKIFESTDLELQKN